jgi:5-methylcytosine-specific restriction enzyme subunit McrC
MTLVHDRLSSVADRHARPGAVFLGWELFVLNCARGAVPAGFRVEHGTTAGRRVHLLRSDASGTGMGRLRPDVLILRGDRVAAVIDAKYKRLTPSRERPNGIDQADLYQIAAYASRYQPEQAAALIYPYDNDGEPAPAEAGGPWHGAGTTFLFQRLPTEPAACRDQLASLLSR